MFHPRTLTLLPVLTSLLAALVLCTPAQAWEWTSGGNGNTIAGSGKGVDEVRAVPAFTRIRVDGSFTVNARMAASPSVSVHADDNIAPLVTTTVQGDTLVLGMRPGASYRSRQAVVVNLTYAQLVGADLRGSGDLNISQLKAERFDLSLSGSGDARLTQSEVGLLNLNLAGSGDIWAQGRADQAQVSIAGSGDMRLADLQSKRMSVNIAGSGDARVHATESLAVNIAGSGDVSYSGKPAQVQRNVVGSGEVRPAR